jgi:hypothetical protein
MSISSFPQKSTQLDLFLNEQETAATRIKSAAEAKYRDAIPRDIVIEIVAEFLDAGDAM